MTIYYKKTGKSPYKLDPSSHRYRICPNRHCGKEHMVSHLSRQYCSDRCADEDYRTKIKEGAAPAEPRNRHGPFGFPWPPGMVKVPPVTPVSPDQYLAGVRKNVELIDALNVDPVKGTLFEKSYLIRAGLNLHYNSGIRKVLNIEEKYGCKYLLFEKYILINTSDNKALIGYAK